MKPNPVSNCKDCGLALEGYGEDHHDAEITLTMIPEHVDRCCDCTEELLGMGATHRERKRPNKKHIWKGKK